MSAGPCYYTYAVARPFAAEAIGHLRGIDEAAIRLVRHRDLVAVTSAFPPEAADDDAVRARLETLESLESMARCHHAVVEVVAARTATIPCRLATVHHDEQAVVRMLRHRHAEFDATLHRLSGRVEMGVKVYAEASAAPSAHRVESDNANPGRDYLQRRRTERDGRERASLQAVDVAERLDAALARLAVERTRHRPQPRQLREDPENVLNAAYLVAAGDLAPFHTLVRRVGADVLGVRIEVTGPWAPYSFAGLDLGDEQ